MSMSWEKHVEFQESLIEDEFLCEPDDRDPQDYAMEEAELNSDFWDEQILDEYRLQRAIEESELQEIIDKGES